MALSPEAEKRLNEMANTLPHPTHQTPLDYRSPIDAFVGLYDAGDTASLHPDTVRDWALRRGWSPEEARDLGRMAEIVTHTETHRA